MYIHVSNKMCTYQTRHEHISLTLFCSVREEVESEGRRKRTTSDPKAEVQKLFSHLKTSRHDSKKLGKSQVAWREKRGPRTPFVAISGGPVHGVVVDTLKQLEAWKVLQDFCLGLPVLKKLEEDKAFLSAPAGEGGPGVETLVER